MSRTKRKAYTGSKAVDRSCRSHGGCPYCEGGRLRYRQVADDIEASQIDAETDADGEKALDPAEL